MAVKPRGSAGGGISRDTRDQDAPSHWAPARVPRSAGGGEGDAGAVSSERAGYPPDLDGGHAPRREEGGPSPPTIAATMAAGGLVPDAFVISLIEERLKDADCAHGFLLDGFPRTAAQADALDAMLARHGHKIDAALALGVPRDLLVERTVLRRTDKRTGQIYHLKYKPPPPGTEVEHRADDREEVVCKTARYIRADDLRAPPLLREARTSEACGRCRRRGRRPAAGHRSASLLSTKESE